MPALVTVGIPTRNRRVYVMRAIASVLAQSYAQIEVVVSDNASTDDTVACVRTIDDMRLRLVEHDENIGMVSNFNATLQAARGEFFVMLSDDDYLAPDAIEILIGAFEHQIGGMNGSEVGVSWTPSTIVDSTGLTQWISQAGPACESGFDFIEGSFRDGRGPRFCGIMVRTNDARIVGGYQRRHGPPCDVGNWAQIALRYPYVVCTQRSLSFYTIHPFSETNVTTSSTWKCSGEAITQDLLDQLRRNGRHRELARMQISGNALIGDLIIAGLSQSAGQRGWVWKAVREVSRTRKYLFTFRIARRFWKNAWKLKRLITNGRTAQARQS